MLDLKQSIPNFKTAILSLDQIKAKKILIDLSDSFPINQVIDKLIVTVLEQIGEGWEQGNIALSQVYMSGRICKELVDTFLLPSKQGRKHKPKIALAVLEDYHLLGKRIVHCVLRASGYDPIDYGHGISVDELLKQTQKEKIEILLISTLMLRSALLVKKVKEELSKAKFSTKIVVGGAPFLFDDQLWREVGADAMGRSAFEAVEIIKRLEGGLK